MSVALQKIIREPRRINAAQIVEYIIVAGAGTMAALGVATPQFLSNTLGRGLILTVGLILLVGGLTGVVSVLGGWWGWERIGLWIVGIGWVSLLPAAGYFATTGRSPAIWLVFGLVVTALCSVFKRYHHVDWAYLDPNRK